MLKLFRRVDGALRLLIKAQAYEKRNISKKYSGKLPILDFCDRRMIALIHITYNIRSAKQLLTGTGCSDSALRGVRSSDRSGIGNARALEARRVALKQRTIPNKVRMTSPSNDKINTTTLTPAK